METFRQDIAIAKCRHINNGDADMYPCSSSFYLKRSKSYGTMSGSGTMHLNELIQNNYVQVKSII